MNIFFHLVFVSAITQMAVANDSIYGGYNPADRDNNPAGLENPLGVKKMLCREILSDCLPCTVIVAAQIQRPLPNQQLEQAAQQNAEQASDICAGRPIRVFTTDMDASLIDPQVNVSGLDLTIGEYVTACEDLAFRGKL